MIKTMGRIAGDGEDRRYRDQQRDIFQCNYGQVNTVKAVIS